MKVNVTGKTTYYGEIAGRVIRDSSGAATGISVGSSNQSTGSSNQPTATAPSPLPVEKVATNVATRDTTASSSSNVGMLIGRTDTGGAIRSDGKGGVYIDNGQQQSNLNNPTPVISVQGDTVFVNGQGYSVAQAVQNQFINNQLKTPTPSIIVTNTSSGGGGGGVPQPQIIQDINKVTPMPQSNLNNVTPAATAPTKTATFISGTKPDSEGKYYPSGFITSDGNFIPSNDSTAIPKGYEYSTFKNTPENYIYNDKGEVVGVESKYFGKSMTIDRYNNEINRIKEATPKEKYYSPQTGKTYEEPQQVLVDGVKLIDLAPVKVFTNPQTGEPIKNINDYIKENRLPINPNEGGLPSLYDYMGGLRETKTYDTQSIPGKYYASWQTDPGRAIPITSNDVILAVGGGLGLAKLGGVAATKIALSGPITELTSKGIDYIAPRADSGFSIFGIPRQVERGLIFSALTPLVGVSYGVQLGLGLATNPVETGKGLYEYARKNPYEIATVSYKTLAEGIDLATRTRIKLGGSIPEDFKTPSSLSFAKDIKVDINGELPKIYLAKSFIPEILKQEPLEILKVGVTRLSPNYKGVETTGIGEQIIRGVKVSNISPSEYANRLVKEDKIRLNKNANLNNGELGEFGFDKNAKDNYGIINLSKKLNKEQKELTLAHELIHYNTPRSVLIYGSVLPYRMQPGEILAFSLMKKRLLEGFKNKIDIGLIPERGATPELNVKKLTNEYGEGVVINKPAIPRLNKIQTDVLNTIKGTGDVVTGSFAQKVLSELNRKPGDFDIVSKNPELTTQRIMEQLGNKVKASPHEVNGIRVTSIEDMTGTKIADVVGIEGYKSVRGLIGFGNLKTIEVNGIKFLEPKSLLQKKFETIKDEGFKSKKGVKTYGDIKDLTGGKFNVDTNKATLTGPYGYTEGELASYIGQTGTVTTSAKGLFSFLDKLNKENKPITKQPTNQDYGLFATPFDLKTGMAMTRVTRLGVTAGLKDLFSGNVDFNKPGKPQIVLFENQKIGDDFRVPFKSSELEVEAPIGKVIKYKQSAGVTIINGKRITIAIAEFVKPQEVLSKNTLKQLEEAKQGNLNNNQLERLKKQISSETGISSSSDKPYYNINNIVSPLVSASQKQSRDYSNLSSNSYESYNLSSAPSIKTFTNSSNSSVSNSSLSSIISLGSLSKSISSLSSPISSISKGTSSYTTLSKSGSGYKPVSNYRTSVQSPSYYFYPFNNNTPKKKILFDWYPKENKKIEGVTGYRTFFKRYGKEVFLPGIRSKGLAEKYGQEYTLKNLRATFGVKPTSYKVKQPETNFKVRSDLFRDYKVRGGKKITLDDTYIQRRGKRLYSRGELSELQTARQSVNRITKNKR